MLRQINIQYEIHYDSLKEIIIIMGMSLLKKSTVLFDSIFLMIEEMMVGRIHLVSTNRGKSILNSILAYLNNLLNLFLPIVFDNQQHEKLMKTF